MDKKKDMSMDREAAVAGAQKSSPNVTRVVGSNSYTARSVRFSTELIYERTKFLFWTAILRVLQQAYYINLRLRGRVLCCAVLSIAVMLQNLKWLFFFLYLVFQLPLNSHFGHGRTMFAMVVIVLRQLKVAKITRIASLTFSLSDASWVYFAVYSPSVCGFLPLWHRKPDQHLL